MLGSVEQVAVRRVRRCWQTTGCCTDDWVSACQQASPANVEIVEGRKRGIFTRRPNGCGLKLFLFFRSSLRRGGSRAETPSAPPEVAPLLF